MLKKGDNFLNGMNITKKSKLHTEPNESYNQFNKENITSKSLYEDDDQEHNFRPNKRKEANQSFHGSTMVSPTFQSPDLINLKDDRFKQDKGYLNINFSLKDVEKKTEDRNFQKQTNSKKQGQSLDEFDLRLRQQVQKRLTEHYQAKKYWSKIQPLFQQQGADAVIAWKDSISNYNKVKKQNQKLKEQQQSQLARRDQKIMLLEKQILQDKTQTKVLSHKKCRGCEHLEQKQEEYHHLFDSHKQLVKNYEEVKENLTTSSDQLKKLDQKYKNLIFLKEQVEKKNAKLLQKQKQLESQLQKMKKALKEDSSNSKQLHIEIEKEKQAKHQLEKSLNKIEQKYRRQIVELKEQIKSIRQEKAIVQAQSEKIKNELNQIRPKWREMQFQLQGVNQSLKIKAMECDNLKKRHVENMSEEVNKNNDSQEQIKRKEEQLRNAYNMIDQMENCKVSLQLELNKERKIVQERDQQLNKYMDSIKELEQKLKQLQNSEHRIKEANQMFSVTKQNFKNNSVNTQSKSVGNTQNNVIIKKIAIKIKEMHSNISQVSEDSLDSYQRKKNRDDLSEERQMVNLFKTEKYVTQISNQLSNLLNKYYYIQNENDNLKKRIEDQITYKDQESLILQRQIELKEQALKCISSFIPEQLKDVAIQFLLMTEKLSNDEHHQQLQYQEYDQLKDTLENQGKEWKQNYIRMILKFKKMEDELKRLEEENFENKRRTQFKEVKKTLPTDYEYREVSKKDIRRKYNFDN